MEIYAEISKEIQYQLDENNYDLRLPPGVQYSRKAGSRSLFIECGESEEIIDMVEDLLDSSGIPFQRNDEVFLKGKF